MTDLQHLATTLIEKIRHYLMTTMGVNLDTASDAELFRALSLALREEIMINWTATLASFQKNQPRTLYYLCMEYMPGRILEGTTFNIHAQDLFQLVMKKLGRDGQKIIRIERDPGLGNGGLGRLSSCLLDALATKQYPAFGYGLRYHYGIFDQEIRGGEQVERPEIWLLNENPWEFRRDAKAALIWYAGRAIPKRNLKNEETYDLVDYEEVRALPYDLPIVGYRETPDFNVLSLRLWSTKESPRNFALQRYNAGLLDQAAENTTLTDVLYPNDNNEMGKRIRLKQEYLLAAASLQDIVAEYRSQFSDMSAFADKVRIHINDTHAALVIPELMHLLLKSYDFSFDEAFELVQTCCNYTNHTVLRESLEQWNENRMSTLLPRQYRIIQRLNEKLCENMRAKSPGDEEKVRRLSMFEGGQIKMAHLAVFSCHKVNGVAHLHTEILQKELFPDFYALDPHKFVAVTNGVTQRRWLYLANPRLSQFLIKRIGKGWITDLSELQGLSKYAKDPDTQNEFLEIKRQNKQDLIAFLKNHNPLRDAAGKVVGTCDPLTEEALFDVQIKRFHEYKRQLMNALHALMLYEELGENREARKISRMILIGGKAAPGYVLAKEILLLINLLSRKINQDPKMAGKLRLIFFENYNASRALRIIPGADLSEQISCAGMEASGTGNMKLALNGALTIATEDGSNIEMHAAMTEAFWPFSFGKSAAQNRELHKNKSYNPWDIYMGNRQIKRAVDRLKDRSLTQTEEEHEALVNIFNSLLAHNSSSDEYFVLGDLESYYNTQKKVEELYLNPSAWAEMAIQNIAHMGPFSIDASAARYAELVWGLLPSPVDSQELKNMREQFASIDKCRIL